MPTAPSRDARFSRLFEAHHAELHAYCLRRLAVADADEAVSEVFLVAWRRSEKVPSGDEARLWLYGVARNVVRNWERSGRRRQRLVARTGTLATPDLEDAEVQVIRSEEQREVIAAIATLPAKDQEVVRLKIWEGISNAEVGAVLGMTDRAVEARYTRAIKKLHNHLRRDAPTRASSPFSSDTEEAAS